MQTPRKSKVKFKSGDLVRYQTLNDLGIVLSYNRRTEIVTVVWCNSSFFCGQYSDWELETVVSI